MFGGFAEIRIKNKRFDSRIKKKGPSTAQTLLDPSAEKEGFEPPVPYGTTVFKTAALDRSAISPGAKVQFFLFLIDNYGKFFFSHSRPFPDFKLSSLFRASV
jgi:hypothetical protein